MEWEKDDRITKWVRHPCSVLELSRMGNSTDVYIKFDNAWFNATLGPNKKNKSYILAHTHKQAYTCMHILSL